MMIRRKEDEYNKDKMKGRWGWWTKEGIKMSIMKIRRKEDEDDEQKKE